MLHPQMSVQRIYLKINRHSFSNALQLNLAAWFKDLKKEVGINYAPWNNDLYHDFYLFAVRYSSVKFLLKYERSLTKQGKRYWVGQGGVVCL